MSNRHLRNRVLILTVPLLLIGGLALSVLTASQPEPRSLVVVAENMAFYVEGQPTPNPEIALIRGERVRLTFVNRDTRIDHDLAAPEIGFETDVLPGDGSRQEIRLTAPQEPGRYEYVCSLHDRMMRGVLVVR